VVASGAHRSVPSGGGRSVVLTILSRVSRRCG
jgi:hypothetical protein